jgi:hypothetical protein
MRFFSYFFLLGAVIAPGLAPAQSPHDQPSALHIEAQQLFVLANQARAESGLRPLAWEPSLAAAALQHCRRMAVEGPIAHRYGGEPDLTARAAQAGAHFSLIEENVAVGPSAAGIHDQWMHSPGHRSNLLSPQIDRVGIAVVSTRGVLYATADYARAVPALSAHEVEARVAALIRSAGVAVLSDSTQARAACATGSGVPRSAASPQPLFVMRWQDSDLTRLPRQLADRLASGRYRQAAVGSCPAQGIEGSFTSYRLAVLLF